jgi:hypothetical protein
MITRAAATEEGREQGKVNTENKGPGKSIWLAPVLLALPILAAMAFAAIRFGPLIVKLINAAVKATVVV